MSRSRRQAALDDIVDERLRADENPVHESSYAELRAAADLDAEESLVLDVEIAARRAAQFEALRTELALTHRIPGPALYPQLRRRSPMARLQDCIRRASIDWHDDGVNPVKAYVMACLSEIAYLHLTDAEVGAHSRYKLFEPSVAHSLLAAQGWRFDLRQVFNAATGDLPLAIIERPRFVYLVIRMNDFTIIAVRGTRMHKIDDWAIDLDFLKNPATDGFYHRGFHDEACAALGALVAAVDGRAPLYLTGHSLGAAVASILAQIWPDLHPARHPDPHIVKTPYVFASPRFATRAAARRQPRHAFARPFDIVPHLPPKWLGYSDDGALATRLSRPPGAAAAARISRNPHSIESIRRLMGLRVGEDYAETAYVDVLVDVLKMISPQS